MLISNKFCDSSLLPWRGGEWEEQWSKKTLPHWSGGGDQCGKELPTIPLCIPLKSPMGSWYIKPPMDYRSLINTALYVMVLMRANPVRGGWALEILTFLGPKWHSPIGSMPFHRTQKGLDFQGRTPSYWNRPHLNHYLQGRIPHVPSVQICCVTCVIY
jgi:hypothetical protein